MCITPELMILTNILYICFPAIFISCSNCCSFEYVVSFEIASSFGDLLIHCGRIRNQIIYILQNIVSSFCPPSLHIPFFDGWLFWMQLLPNNTCCLFFSSFLDTEQEHTIWHSPHSSLWSITLIHKFLCILQ